MIERDSLFPIGYVTKPHGVHGEMSVTLEQDVDLAQVRCICFDMDGLFVPFFIKNCRYRGTSAQLITIDGVENETQATTFTGKQVFLLKDDVEIDSDTDIDPDNIYLEDLIGFKLMDSDSTVVGTVNGYDDSTENVLFNVENENGQQLLVPAADDLIINIDINNRNITMNLPTGLF